jgi:Putative abortive phage resistance protein AbiGi, antitoxin
MTYALPGYVADDLVHFVGFRDPLDHARNWDVLKTILDSGEILAGGHPRGATVLERNLGEKLSSNTRYEPSMACFADIPEDQLTIHTGKYSRFGLALRKATLIPQGVRPVLYVPYGASPGVMAQSPLIEEDWNDIVKLLEQHVLATFGGHTAAPPGSADAMRIDEWIEFAMLAYIKFFDSTLAPADPANYYMEREWRSHSGVVFAEGDVTAVYLEPGWLDKAEAAFPALVGRIKELT